MSSKLILIGAGLLLLHTYNKKQKAKAPKVYYRKKLIGSLNAKTVPPVGIFIKESERNNQALLNHELVHWQQYQREGLLKFYFKYLFQQLKNGYDGNEYEIEARCNETEYCRLNYTECVRRGLAKTIHDPNFRR